MGALEWFIIAAIVLLLACSRLEWREVRRDFHGGKREARKWVRRGKR